MKKKKTKKKVIKAVITPKKSRITDEIIKKFITDDEDNFFELALIVCKKNMHLFLAEHQRIQYLAKKKALS